MPTRHKLGTSSPFLARRRPVFGHARPRSARLEHLPGMETTTATLDTVLTLSELAARLGVTVQTIYDLRSQGRGPRGFRVGRELRFRVTQIDAWPAHMEEADAARPRGRRWAVPVALLAGVSYLYAASVCATLVERGAPGFLNLLVTLYFWNAVKCAWLVVLAAPVRVRSSRMPTSANIAT